MSPVELARGPEMAPAGGRRPVRGASRGRAAVCERAGRLEAGVRVLELREGGRPRRLSNAVAQGFRRAGPPRARSPRGRITSPSGSRRSPGKGCTCSGTRSSRRPVRPRRTSSSRTTGSRRSGPTRLARETRRKRRASPTRGSRPARDGRFWAAWPRRRLPGSDLPVQLRPSGGEAARSVRER